MEVNLKLLNRLKNLIFVNDEKFLMYYQKTRAKGLLKFVAKYASISAIVMIIMGRISIARNMRFYGFEKEDTLLVSIIMGLIAGTLISLLGWAIDNDRYLQIKKKNESKTPD
jgi:hypothetical protein